MAAKGGHWKAAAFHPAKGHERAGGSEIAEARERLEAHRATRAEARRQKFAPQPELAAKMAATRRSAAAAIASVPSAPKGMTNVHLGGALAGPVRLSYRKGPLGIWRDGLGNSYVHELTTGMEVARLRDFRTARSFVAGAHRSIGRILDRVEAGDPKARTALLSYVERYEKAARKADKHEGPAVRNAAYRRLMVKSRRMYEQGL